MADGGFQARVIWPVCSWALSPLGGADKEGRWVGSSLCFGLLPGLAFNAGCCIRSIAKDMASTAHRSAAPFITGIKAGILVWTRPMAVHLQMPISKPQRPQYQCIIQECQQNSSATHKWRRPLIIATYACMHRPWPREERLSPRVQHVDLELDN